MGASTDYPNQRRKLTGLESALIAVWWVAAVVMLLPMMMMLVASDLSEENFPGAVILVLIVAAVAAAVTLRSTLAASIRAVASVVASGVWVAGAILVYPTQNYLADTIYAAGVPLAVGLLTAALALTYRGGRAAEPRQP